MNLNFSKVNVIREEPGTQRGFGSWPRPHSWSETGPCAWSRDWSWGPCSPRVPHACSRTQAETGRSLVLLCLAIAQWCRLSFGKWLLWSKHFEKISLNHLRSCSWDGFPWPPTARQEEPPPHVSWKGRAVCLGGWSAPWKVDAGIRHGAVSTSSWWHLTELGAQRPHFQVCWPKSKNSLIPSVARGGPHVQVDVPN